MQGGCTSNRQEFRSGRPVGFLICVRGTEMEFEQLLKMVPIPAPRTKLRKEEFGAMLISGDLPILRLNEDAADVWQLCNGNRSIHEIISLLENSYEKEELTSRLEELLSFFIDNNILLDASKNRIE